jgi:hypothetical protein
LLLSACGGSGTPVTPDAGSDAGSSDDAGQTVDAGNEEPHDGGLFGHIDGGLAALDVLLVDLPDGGTALVRPLGLVTPGGARANPDSQLLLVHVPADGDLGLRIVDLGDSAPGLGDLKSNRLPVDEGLAVVRWVPGAPGKRALHVTPLGSLGAADTRNFGLNQLSVKHEAQGDATHVSFVAAFDVSGQAMGAVVLGAFDVSVRDGEFSVTPGGLVRREATPCEGGSPIAPRRFVRQLQQGAIVCGPVLDADGSEQIASGITGLLRLAPDGGLEVVPNLGDAPQGSFLVSSTWHRDGSAGREVVATAQDRSNINPTFVSLYPDAFERPQPGALLGSAPNFILVDAPVRARVDGKVAFVLHCSPQTSCQVSQSGGPPTEVVAPGSAGTTGVLLVGLEERVGTLVIASHEWVPLSADIAAAWPFGLLGVEVVETPAASGQPRQLDVSVLVARRDGDATRLEEVRRRYTWSQGSREKTAEATHAFARVEHPSCPDARAPWEDARNFGVTLDGQWCDSDPGPRGQCAATGNAAADRVLARLWVPVGDADCDGTADEYVPVTYARERSQTGSTPFDDSFFVSPAAAANTARVRYSSGGTAATAVATMRLDSTPARLSTNVTVPKQTQGATFGERVNAGLSLLPNASGATVGGGTGVAAPHTMLRTLNDAKRGILAIIR